MSRQVQEPVAFIMDATVDREPIDVPQARLERVVFLEGHSASGALCVELVLRLPDGRTTSCVTSLLMLETIAVAMVSRATSLGYQRDASGRLVRADKVMS